MDFLACCKTVMAAIHRHGPMQGLVSILPSVESIVPRVPAPMMAEPQIVTILRTGFRVGPNAAIAAVKFHHGK